MPKLFIEAHAAWSSESHCNLIELIVCELVFQINEMDYNKLYKYLIPENPTNHFS
jgi:hypothetical protein